MNDSLHTNEETAPRHYGLVMAFAVVGVAIVIASSFVGDRLASVLHYGATSTPPVVEEETPSPFARFAPKRLRIPAISLDAGFVAPLGLNADQTVSVPDSYDEVGWYQHGATPGENGPAVILGHVDSHSGPAVFFSLGQLKAGDEIEIDREDSTTAVFVVERLERVSQDQFPTEAVYGWTDKPVLRLVTCTGLYDRGTQRYTHNLVVFASLKEGSGATTTPQTP